MWFQRKQVAAAIEGMEEQSSHLFEQSIQADQTLDVLRAQSEAIAASAQISALSILIPVKEKQLEFIRHNVGRGAPHPENVRLPAFEQDQVDRIAELESLLKQIKYKRETD